MNQLGINHTGPDRTSIVPGGLSNELAGHQPFPDLVMNQLSINHPGPDRASTILGLSNEPAGNQPYRAG